MARLFAVRVAEGRTQWAQVPPKLRQAVADILVNELGLLGLVPAGGQVTAGEICFQGRDLRQLSEKERRKLRGDRLAMIFQDPMTSLNPVYPVGRQVAEVLRLHRGMGLAARPGKRWDSIVSTLLAALAGAFAAWLISGGI